MLNVLNPENIRVRPSLRQSTRLHKAPETTLCSTRNANVPGVLEREYYAQE